MVWIACKPIPTINKMLGKRLYPLVDQLEHDHAAKVTGMLLEMDKSKILHLLETPEALKAKVAEAMAVLRNVAGGMLSVPFDMGGMPIRDCGTTQPIPIGALASALANATLEQQMTFLGERLYPLVDQLEHDHATKVTGMLLEMDQTEILHLLESPEALKAKVTEAMKVLRDAAGDMLPSPYDKVHIPIQAIDILQPVPTEALALALANATPEQQRVMLGESLYPLLDQLGIEHAVKAIGMLLKMDKTTALYLLDSLEAFKANVRGHGDSLKCCSAATA